MATAITMTTLSATPKNLGSICRAMFYYSHKSSFVVIAGDTKTPTEIILYCGMMAKKWNVRVEFLAAHEQKEVFNGSKYSELNKYIPFCSFARRLYADLYAYENGADCIIRIDDDNFVTDGEDFIAQHKRNLGKRIETVEVRTEDDWYNCCSPLVFNVKDDIFPRGYPYKQYANFIKRNYDSPQKRLDTLTTGHQTIMVNAGLWMGDPDVDAITRLRYGGDIKAIGYKHMDNVALSKQTWSVFNTQNTAYHKDIIPASMVFPDVGRYDDIYGSYLTLCIMKTFGHSVSFGKPFVSQDRNDHDIFVDLERELEGNKFLWELLAMFKSFTPKENSKSYKQRFVDLADHISKECAVTHAKKTWLHIVNGMYAWAECFD